MLNRYFDDEALTVLLRPAAWQVAGGHGLAEIEPVRDEVHERWLREHHHAHSYTEVCLMLAGDGRHACAGPVYPFGAGTVYCFLPGDTHDEEPPPHLAYNRQLWFRVQQEVVMAGLIEVRDGAWSRPWARSVILARPELGWTDCRRPFASLADPALPVAIRRMQLRAAVMQLVAATLTAGYQPDDLVDGESFQGQVIAAVCQHLEATAGAGESLDTLARLAGYSRFHFVRLFRRHTGRSVHEYIDACRVRRAQELEADGRPQRVIAAALGFSSPAVYSRWRRQVYLRARAAEAPQS